MFQHNTESHKGATKKINSLMSYADMKQFPVLMTKEQLTAVQARTAIFC
jgi:hypothetical protein